MNGDVVFGLCLLATGLFLLGAGARQMLISASLHRDGVTTVATVVAVTEDGMSVPYGGHRTWYDITVSFTTADGVAVRATEPGRATTKVGDRLPIVYDPRDPHRVRWNGARPEDPMLWVGGVVLVGMSAFMIVRASRT